MSCGAPCQKLLDLLRSLRHIKIRALHIAQVRRFIVLHQRNAHRFAGGHRDLPGGAVVFEKKPVETGRRHRNGQRMLGAILREPVRGISLPV